MDENIRQLLQSFREVNRVMFRLIREQAESLGITSAQLLVMLQVKENPEVVMSEIAERMKMTNSTLSGVVDRLVVSGLLERERFKNDRRSIGLKLTEQGRQKLDLAFAEDSIFVKRVHHLKSIPAHELQMMRDVHQKIINLLQQEEEEH